MVSETLDTVSGDEQTPVQITIDELSADELEALRDTITAELEQRRHDHDLEDAECAELVNGKWVKWKTLSAHANRKAVKPWILHVTDTHDEYGVDGTWLDKQQIDGDPHMNVADLSDGDIIRVSGASHNNEKHRYYRVLAVTDTTLYYEPQYGLDEATVIEDVG